MEGKNANEGASSKASQGESKVASRPSLTENDYDVEGDVLVVRSPTARQPDEDSADENGDSNEMDESSYDGQEIYSVYDDDEAWPRRLGGDEVELADQFFDAVECGECDDALRLLGEFAPLVNVTRQNQGGDFALYIAAGMGDLKMTQTILAGGRGSPVQMHARTVHGHTALSAAALFGHPDVVELLMSCGLDVNSKNVEGLVLIDEVLDDIDYSLVGEGEDSDSSSASGSAAKNENDVLEASMSSIAQGSSDPLLLEKAAILLLRGGAEISMSNCFAFHEKFCGAWADVTDEELQEFIEEACERAESMEREKARQQEERARTPALVLRRVNGDVAAMAEESRPSLFKTTSPKSSTAVSDQGKKAIGSTGPDRSSSGRFVPEVGDGTDAMSPSGFADLKPKGSPGIVRKSPRVSPPAKKSGRSRAGRVRQRRYVRSPKVTSDLGSGSIISPSKPPSPDRSKDVGARGGGRIIEDISSLIVEGAGEAEDPPPLPPRNNKKSSNSSDVKKETLSQTRSDESLEVSWSKQLAQNNSSGLPARPRSQDASSVAGDPLEESHPPRVKLPVIGKK